MPRLDLRSLTKVFSPAKTFQAWVRSPWQSTEPVIALRDLSLSLESGEVLCVMGENGAGKTTLLKLVAGLLHPTRGEVLINGTDVQSHRLQLNARLGFANSAQPGFYDLLTGRQNLEFFATLYGCSRTSARQRIQELLALFDIEAPDRRYQEFSSGTKQRLLLARTFLHRPEILLLDEPTRGLDPVQTQHVHALIKAYVRQHASLMLLTTHQVWEAEAVSTRIALLRRGTLQAVDPGTSPAEMFRCLESKQSA